MGYFARQYWPEAYYAPEYWGEPNVDLSATLAGAGVTVADFSVPADLFSATLQGQGAVVADITVSADVLSATLQGQGDVVADITGSVDVFAATLQGQGAVVGDITVWPDVLASTLIGQGVVVADITVSADIFVSTLFGRGYLTAGLTEGVATYWAQGYYSTPYFAQNAYWGSEATEVDLGATLSGTGAVDATFTAFPKGWDLRASLFDGAVPWNTYFRAFPKGAFPEQPFGTLIADLEVAAGALGSAQVGQGITVADFSVGPDIFSAALVGQGDILLANLEKTAYAISSALVGQGTVVADITVSADVFAAVLSGTGTVDAELHGSFFVAALSGTGDLVSDLTIQPAVSFEATIAGAGTVIADITRPYDFSSILAGQGDLVAEFTTGALFLDATLLAQGSVVADFRRGVTLSGGDVDNIVDALWSKLVIEQLVSQVEETWERQVLIIGTCSGTPTKTIIPTTSLVNQKLNAYKDGWLIIQDGSAIDERKQITSSSYSGGITTLIVTPFATAPASGDAFVIA